MKSKITLVLFCVPLLLLCQTAFASSSSSSESSISSSSSSSVSSSSSSSSSIESSSSDESSSSSEESSSSSSSSTSNELSSSESSISSSSSSSVSSSSSSSSSIESSSSEESSSSSEESSSSESSSTSSSVCSVWDLQVVLSEETTQNFEAPSITGLDTTKYNKHFFEEVTDLYEITSCNGVEQEKRKLGRIRDYAEGTYDKYYSDLKNIFQKGSITRTRTYDADEGFKLTSASGTIEDTVNEVAPSHDLHYGLYSFNYVGKRREIIAVAEGPSGDLVESSRLRREEKGSCYSKEGKFSYSITDFTYDEEGETIKELKTTDINLAWIYPDVKKRFSEVSATYSKLWGDTLISKNTIEVNQFFYDYGKSFEATEYVSSEDYTHEQKYSLSFGYKPSTTTALPDKFEAFEGSFDLTTNISGEEHSYFGRYKADASGDADSNGFVPVNIRLYINPLVGGGISIGYSTPWSTLWSTLSLGTILNWHNSYEFLDSGYASLDTIRISGDDFILDMGGRDKVTANAITSPEDNFERPEMPAFK